MLLRSAYLFQDCSDDSLQAITSISKEDRHPAGAFLFRTDEPASALFILCEGRVRVSVSRGGHIAHTVSAPGEALGWSSMAGFETYSASAECTTPTTVIRIPRVGLADILEGDPASGMTFFERLARQIGKRLFESYGATLSMHGQKGSFGG